MSISGQAKNQLATSRGAALEPGASRLQASHDGPPAEGPEVENGEGSAEASGSSRGKASRAEASRKRRGDSSESQWVKCRNCGKLIYKSRMEEMLFVCPECNFHFEIPGPVRIDTLIDEGTFEEHFQDLSPLDPLEFSAKKAYKDRLLAAQKNTGLKDACLVGTGKVETLPVVFGVSDSRFLRGSMGSVVGEKICRGLELAAEKGIPFIFVSGSGGGARMDEGILSLMQMAKTSAAVAEFSRQGGLFISILTNPTMGGAMASFAALGDVIIAEPKALIGFAGPNVIRQTIRSEIPEGFQTSEFLLEHGFLDFIADRSDLKSEVARLIRYLHEKD